MGILEAEAAGAVPREVRAGLPLDISLEAVSRGEIVLARGALQSLGFLEKIELAALSAVWEVASEESAARVAAEGFERLHRILTGEQVFAMLRLLTAALSPLGAPLVREFTSHLTRPAGEVFAYERVNVRIIMPQEYVAANRRLFAGKFGHLIVHNPHRDWWFSQAFNLVNLWMAVGRVSRGNSILIYPEVFRRDLRRSGKTVAWDEPLGVPLNFQMWPGDILVFHGHHLHSSEINLSDETRFVVSARFTMGEPEHRGRGPRAAYYKV